MRRLFSLSTLALWFLFLASRFYIYQNPPLYYSDVTADYERYANIWRYGLTPYTEHLYEYPPATIPLLSVPLELDQRGIGKYYPNYRAQILVIDVAFFGFLWATMLRLPWKKKTAQESLLIYIGLTTLAKDFYYEGIDLAFTASMTASLVVPVWSTTKSTIGQIVGWTLFWLSTAIKFLTLPLGPLMGLLYHRSMLKTLLAGTLGFLLIWGAPLALYRSSLQVSFVHNNARPIKYASFPAHIIRWIDVFTDSEQQLQKAPDFPYQGPVSTTTTKLVKITFPTSLVVFLIWMGTRYLNVTDSKLSLSPVAMYKTAITFLSNPHQLTQDSKVFFGLKMYGVYIFVLFLGAKIFSQPFHIWYMPVLVLLPWNKKVFSIVVGLATVMILLDTTTLLAVSTEHTAGPVPLQLIRDVFRFIPMIGLLGLIARNHNQRAQDS